MASSILPPLYRFAPSELVRHSTTPRDAPPPDPNQAQYPPILVVGAGELGLAILHALAAHPCYTQISVLLRPSRIATTRRYFAALAAFNTSTINSMQGTSSQRAVETMTLQNLGIELVAGDYVEDSEEVLASIFGKFHTVIGASGYEHGGVGLQAKLARAVLRAGTSRYLPWQFGVDYDVLGVGSSQDLFDEQCEVRALLRGQTKTAWVIVSVGVFMSYLLENEDFGIVDRKERKVRALGSWDTKVTVTDANDIAVLTAAILAEEPQIKNEVVFVAGDTVSYGDVATLVEELGKTMGSGFEFERELWTNEHLLSDLRKDPENGLKKYRPVFASHEGIAWEKKDSWNGRKGYETRSVKDAVATDLRAALSEDRAKQ